ncbi:MAG: radical SAM protein, partial [Alphaproteobacteria bacterium]|nr:radical SAM protein [Alphaproteobacteria bacterium]
MAVTHLIFDQNRSIAEQLCGHRTASDSFYLDDARAMVSLGPIARDKPCPNNCAFCYLQDGFCQYESANANDVVWFLEKNKNNPHRMIYISGDTDSFAPPRMVDGMGILSGIAHSRVFSCNATLTTRTTFNQSQIESLQYYNHVQKAKGKVLVVGISISRYSAENNYLEPAPVPSPDARCQTIIDLKKAGIPTLLALRPFLPVVGIDEYMTILDNVAGYVDIVLGEPYYFKKDGHSIKRVFNGRTPPKSFWNNVTESNFAVDKNAKGGDIWMTFNSKKAEAAIRKKS